VTTVELPDGVLGMADRTPDWARWVDGLPKLAAEILEEWGLAQVNIAQHGYCALILPVTTSDGDDAMLKVAFPEEESEYEHLALSRWDGNGAVRLLRADPARRAMLLEQLHDRDLTDLPDIEACEVVARLYARLHVPAPPQVKRLSTQVGQWLEMLAELPREAPVPRRLVEQSMAIGRDFASDSATDGVLVHGDLHYLNVLAADREPWLTIDPKPLSGDPAFECAPMLWNRWREAVDSGDVRRAVRRRFHTLVDVAGLDEHRARDWAVLWETMCVVEEVGLSDPDPEWITISIAVAKAVQD
jgi:streptomycin 6-kinase